MDWEGTEELAEELGWEGVLGSGLGMELDLGEEPAED